MAERACPHGVPIRPRWDDPDEERYSCEACGGEARRPPPKTDEPAPGSLRDAVRKARGGTAVPTTPTHWKAEPTFTREQIREWADKRADDAGRLARYALALLDRAEAAERERGQLDQVYERSAGVLHDVREERDDLRSQLAARDRTIAELREALAKLEESRGLIRTLAKGWETRVEAAEAKLAEQAARIAELEGAIPCIDGRIENAAQKELGPIYRHSTNPPAHYPEIGVVEVTNAHRQLSYWMGRARHAEAAYAAARREIDEQCRLHGIGMEREARLIAERDDARRDAERLRAALRLTEFGSHDKCVVCAGWDCGPHGETPRAHTKDCPVAAALAQPAAREGEK
jgi:hypothetical protein